ELSGATSIGRISPRGTISEFPVPGGQAQDIVTGCDEAMWYTNTTANLVGRMNPTTQASNEFFAPGTPTSLAPADATSLWYTQGTGIAIRRISTCGTAGAASTVPSGNTPQSIVVGDDGNAWFSVANGRIGFITPTG